MLEAEYDSNTVISVMLQRWLNEQSWDGMIYLNGDLCPILDGDRLKENSCNKTSLDPQSSATDVSRNTSTMDCVYKQPCAKAVKGPCEEDGGASDVATYGDVNDTENIGTQQLEIPGKSHFQRSAERQHKRFVLPVTIGHGLEAVEINTCPDSGSDDNFISLDLAERLPVDWIFDDRKKEFRMANGRSVEAVGTISAACCFAGQSQEKVLTMDCIFHVFATLVVPAIVGLKFLLATETLTKHRDRLVEEVIPSRQALRVNCIDTPKRHLLCRINNSYAIKACADTGSDLDLMSLHFAETHSLKSRPTEEIVEFADGSIGYLTGVITTTFCVGPSWDLTGDRLPALNNASQMTVDFYVLDGLITNVIIGQRSLLELDVFNLHTEYIFSDDQVPSDAPLNIIRRVGRLERAAYKAATKLRNVFKKRATGLYSHGQSLL